MKVEKLINYFHTVRYLKFKQVFSRLTRTFKRIDLAAPKVVGLRGHDCDFQAVRLNSRSMFEGGLLTFLNESGPFSDWNDESRSKLWLYNLHYFDDLNSNDACDRLEQHVEFVARWIKENPPLSGNGWEPYPISLRMVNWIKWLLQNDLELDVANASLALQAKVLSQNLETHLLGNHLFANAKALLFAGLYFEGEDADKWLGVALDLLRTELPEQVLRDGGNFELTPMYHSIITADLFDILSLLRAYADPRCAELEADVRRRLSGMLTWLAAMTHPDGKVSFFNDSAIGIAPLLTELVRAGEALGIALPRPNQAYVEHLPDSGYFRLNMGSAVLIGDVARVGPDYIPGHAHADTLSFELSVFGQRVIVNTGISQYGADSERHRQRGTAAHSTVEINGLDSSEVWGGFRVARRAYPIGLSISEGDGQVEIKCGHNGYHRLPGRPTHWRTWRTCENGVVITDRIEGRFNSASARFHLHPSVTVRHCNSEGLVLNVEGGVVRISSTNSSLGIEPSLYSPEFGRQIESKCVVISFDNQSQIQTTITWSKF